jgi:hypothetical protein
MSSVLVSTFLCAVSVFSVPAVVNVWHVILTTADPRGRREGTEH